MTIGTSQFYDSLTFTPPSGSVGDWLIAIVGIQSANFQGSLAVTPPAGWEKLDSHQYLQGASYRTEIAIYVHKSPLATPTAVTWAAIPSAVMWSNFIVTRVSGVKNVKSYSRVGNDGTGVGWPQWVTAAGMETLAMYYGFAAQDGTPSGTQWPNVVPGGTEKIEVPGNTNMRMGACWLGPAGGDLTIVARTVTGYTAGSSNYSNYGFVIAMEPVATLANLTLSTLKIASNVPVGTAIDIGGVTTGSTLTFLFASEFQRVGNQIKTTVSPLTIGTVYPYIQEDLVGASNSPKENWFNLVVTPPRICDYIASSPGTTTPVLPAHQAGDMLICFMFRDGSATAPAAPAGWTPWSTAAGSTCSYRLVYKIATSSSESGGGASTATTCVTSVYRPSAGFELSAGAALAGSVGTTATVSYPTLTLQNTDGTSWIGGAGGHRSVNTAIDTPPAGMVLRHNSVDATDEAAVFDTGAGVASWSQQTVSVGGTASGRLTVAFEIKGAAIGSVSYRRHSTWISLID